MILKNGNGTSLRRTLDDKPNSWRLPAPVTTRVSVISKPRIITWHGTPLPTPSDFTLVPKAIIDAAKSQVILSSPSVRLAGSFAPNVSAGTYTVLVTENSFTLFFDGTNGSTLFTQRRADGFNETLPPGQLTCRGITPGLPGGAAPQVSVLPFFVPGSCGVGFIAGDGTSPDPTNFCFNTAIPVPASAIAAQRSEGREPLTDVPLVITLLAMPEVAAPGTGTQTGSQTTNGSLTVVLDTPSQSSTVDTPINLTAHATDTEGHQIVGWDIFVDGVPLNVFTDLAIRPSIQTPVALTAGVHNITIQAWNDLGTTAVVSNISFTVTDNTGVITGGDPTPTPSGPTPTPTPVPRVPLFCVMLGTNIIPLGESPWETEQHQQHNWVRLYTEQGRELLCTPEHPVYTSRAGRTEARDVRVGDLVVTASGEEKIAEAKAFVRPGIKVSVKMKFGHLFYANGFLSHNIKIANIY